MKRPADSREAHPEDLTRARSKFLFRLVFGLGLLCFIATKVELAEVQRVITQADPVRLSLGLCLILVVSPALGSLQITLLLKGLGSPLSFGKVWFIDMVSRFYGITIPSGLGHGAVRWYRLGEALGDRAVPTVCLLFNRLIQTFTVLGIGFLCWYADQKSDHLNLAFFAGLGLLGLLYGLVLSSPVRKLLDHMSERLVPTKLLAFSTRALESLESASAAGPFLHGSLFTIAAFRQLVNITATYLIALSFGLPITFFVLGWIRAIGFLLSFLPISVAEVGVRELTYLTILESVGVSSQQALAVPLTLTTATLFLAAVGGLLEMSRREQ